MPLPRPVIGLAAVLLCATAFGATAQEKEREASRAPRGPLPDPELLDGAAQKAEKRADHGMLGEFEIPGDDTKSDKVGGQPDKQGAAGPKMEEQNAASKSGGSQDKNAQSGGGGQQQQDKTAQSGGGGGQQGGEQNTQGGGGQKSADASAQGGGGPQGANGGQNGAAGGSPGQNDPNAKAQGLQVGQLNGAQGKQAGQSAAGAGGGKPTQVTLGDPSMQIKPSADAKGAVGAEVAGSTQQMEKAIGSGTGATGGSSSGRGGGGVEKGQTMPKGL